MRRLATTLFVLIALATWAGAQSSPAAPLASEQLKLFQSNRQLLENLVEHSVELVNADTPVEKVRVCHELTCDLGRALRDAADRDDPDRVVELGDYLAATIRLGLLPTIDDARRIVPVGTQAEKELVELTARATNDAKNFELSIPAIGKVGTSAKVKSVRDRLNHASTELTQRNHSR